MEIVPKIRRLVQRQLAGRAQAEVAARLPAQRNGRSPRHRLPAAHAQIPGLQVEQLVPPALRFQHKRKGGVRRNVNGFDGIHHKSHHQAPRHAEPPCGNA